MQRRTKRGAHAYAAHTSHAAQSRLAHSSLEDASLEDGALNSDFVHPQFEDGDLEIINKVSSKPEPAITVLVPIYNVERYIRFALESLAQQTMKDFEVLCINDGSKDNSRHIVQEFVDADARFKVIDKENSGYGASINLGLQHACGRYISILEPDDFFERDALETLLSLAMSSNADVVKADYWFYWSHPRRNAVAGVITDEMTGHVFNAWTEPQIFFANPSVWSAIYKRSFLLGNGIKMLQTPGASFQDLGFTFKVWACAQKIVCTTKPVLHYRQDNEQSSVNNPQKVFCVCDEFDAMEDFIDMVSHRAKLRPFLFRLRYDSYMWNFERLTRELREKFLDTMVGDLARGVNSGDYAPRLFAPYQRKNLHFLLESPLEFLKLYPQNANKVSKATYYFRIGGPKTVKSTILSQ